MRKPGIDIAVPNYNYGRFLPDCLNSIRSQAVADLRILIIDNASTDDSVAVARRMAAKDPRIELRLNERNMGPHASFNAGIDWARGDYFAIVCADDMLAPGALERAIEAMESDRDITVAFGRTDFFGDDGPPPTHAPSGPGKAQVMDGREFIAAFCRSGRTLVDGPTAIVRTAAQKQAGHYRRELPHTDDVEMWLRLGCLGKAVRIDAVQVLARIHAHNQSASVRTVHHWNVEMERAFDCFFADAGRSLPQAGRLHRMARRRLAERAYWCAISHLVRGEPDVAELLRFALARQPLFALIPPVDAVLRRGDGAERIGQTLRAMMARMRPGKPA